MINMDDTADWIRWLLAFGRYLIKTEEMHSLLDIQKITAYSSNIEVSLWQ